MDPFGLASGELSGTQASPVQLFVGEAPIITDSAEASAAIATYQVCVLNADGTITPLTEAAITGGARGADCVIAQIAGLVGDRVPYYSAGRFNHEVIVWPAGTMLDTLDERKEFFHNTPISMGHLLP